MSISARQLQAFVILAETRNFTQAAKACHLSQPAFSALIKALEENVKVRLFARSTRRVELTQEGSLFLESAQRLLRDIQISVSEMHDYADRRKGKVAIAALPSLAAGWLSHVLAAFKETYQGVEIVLYDRLRDSSVELLRRGSVDFALTADGPDVQDLQTDTLFQDYFHLVCRHDHPLAKRTSVRMRDLEGQTLIHFSHGSSIRQHIELYGSFTARHEFSVQYLSTVAGLVRNGLGVSIVPAMSLFQFEHPEIVTPKISDKSLVRSLVMLRRTHEHLSPAPDAFRRMALAMARAANH